VQLHHIAVGLQQRRHHDIPLVHCVSFAAPEQISHDLCVLGPAHFVFGDSNQSMLLSLNQKVSTSDLCAIAQGVLIVFLCDSGELKELNRRQVQLRYQKWIQQTLRLLAQISHHLFSIKDHLV
jgi:hypothetical protein